MTDWNKKWKISNNPKHYIIASNLVSDKLQEIYKNEKEMVAIRIIDKHVATVGFGYVLIEFEDGRFGEVAILPYKEGVRLVPDVMAIINNNTEQNVKQETPAEPDSPLNILNMLNDKCLKKLFEHLPLGDLCSVADTCAKFRKIAKEIFVVQFAELKDEVKWLLFWQVESLFRNFGNEITEFSYDFDTFYEERDDDSIFEDGFHHNVIMLLLVTYCSDTNCPLKSLKIHEINDTRLETQVMNLDPVWNDSLKPIFARLNCLYLDRCNVSSSLLKVSNELTELRLVYPNADVSSVLATPTFNKLEKLTIRYYDANVDDIIERMPKNPRLKSLIVAEQLEDDEYTVELYPIIASKFPNLEELVYITDPHNVDVHVQGYDCFNRFECLKSFKIINANCYLDLVEELIEEQPKLQSLHLGNIMISVKSQAKDFIKNMSHLDELKELTIVGEFFDCDYLKKYLTKAVPSLERLHVEEINLSDSQDEGSGFANFLSD